jgi:hypothetical protein
MTTVQKRRDGLDRYCDLMEEAKGRLFTIDWALGEHAAHHPVFLREICFLQLRMLCEVVALSCLTCHDGIGFRSELRNQYAAQKILGELERLHPHFYPHRLIRTPPTRPDDEAGFGLIEGGVKKDELAALNGKCGDALHRGTLNSLLKPHIMEKNDLSEIKMWRQKFGELLALHLILFLDQKSFVICNLSDPARNGGVSVTVAEHNEPITYLFES